MLYQILFKKSFVQIVCGSNITELKKKKYNDCCTKFCTHFILTNNGLIMISKGIVPLVWTPLEDKI